DGRIVVAGGSRAYCNGVFYAVRVLARYNPDGSLDPGFGTGGIEQEGAFDGWNAVVILKDGSIVAAGPLDVGDEDNPAVWFTVVGHDSDGNTTWWDQLPTPKQLGFPLALAAQADGKVLVSGFADCTHFCQVNTYFVLGRLNPDGSLDASFGSGGLIAT